MQPSSDAHRHLPSQLKLCSRTVGWRSVLLRRYSEPDAIGDFTTLATAYPLLVLVRKGACEIESFEGGRWRRADYRAGDIGLAAPGEASRLLWRRGKGLETLQLHIPAAAMQAAVDGCGPGAGARLGFPRRLRRHDPVVASVPLSLEQALTEGSPDNYAEAAAHFLASQLLIRHAGAGCDTAEARTELEVVEDYMKSKLSEQISLKKLSAVANLSTFQLIQNCNLHWRETPIARLTRLRMDRARELLLGADDSVIQVALECGYQNPSYFATAFRRHIGVAQSRYRADGRGASSYPR